MRAPHTIDDILYTTQELPNIVPPRDVDTRRARRTHSDDILICCFAFVPPQTMCGTIFCILYTHSMSQTLAYTMQTKARVFWRLRNNKTTHSQLSRINIQHIVHTTQRLRANKQYKWPPACAAPWRKFWREVKASLSNVL